MRVSMKIGTRILAGYALALLVVAGVGFVSYRAIGELVDTADWVTHTHQVKENLVSVVGKLTEAEDAQRAFLITGEERYLLQYRTASEAVDHYAQTVQELTTDNPDQQKRIAGLRTQIGAKVARMAEGIDLRRRNTSSETLASFINQGALVMDELRRSADTMIEAENKLLVERDQRAKATADYAKSSVLAGGLLILVLVSTVGLLTQRSITRPLSSFMRFAGRVGEGDLTQQAEVSTGDELGELGRTLNQMVTGLKDVAGQARFATEKLAAASSEILASTQQQAASTGEQAAAVQQTTITMEEVTQSGAQISDRAKQVAASAEATVTASHLGLQAVEGTSKTMQSIREQAEAMAENVVALSEKTQAIGEIISTVNDLAEQSHLLALNAAIEAAAAGEHGRSFSVIASEVKNLADQSREATVQVRGILGDIQKGITRSVMLTEEAVKRVESGKQQAEVADQTIRTMSDSIHQSLQAFQQIVAGSNQQQIGFGQVMQAVRDIGQASLQTAAGTQQLEKAAFNLTSMSQQLQKAVERYRV